MPHQSAEPVRLLPWYVSQQRVVIFLIHKKNWENFGETCFPSVNTTTFAKALAHFEDTTIKKIELWAAAAAGYQ